MSARAPVMAFLAASLAVVSTTACGPKKIEVRPADDLYKEAREFHQDQSYAAAIDAYKQLLDNYPLDPRTEEIELAVARAHYADGAYVESIAGNTITVGDIGGAAAVPEPSRALLALAGRCCAILRAQFRRHPALRAAVDDQNVHSPRSGRPCDSDADVTDAQ